MGERLFHSQEDERVCCSCLLADSAVGPVGSSMLPEEATGVWRSLGVTADWSSVEPGVYGAEAIQSPNHFCFFRVIQTFNLAPICFDLPEVSERILLGCPGQGNSRSVGIPGGLIHRWML